MTKYSYKIVKLNELNSAADYIHYDISYTPAELCAIAAALTLGIMSDSVMGDIGFFCPALDWGFTDETLKEQHGLAILRLDDQTDSKEKSLNTEKPVIKLY